MGHQKQAKFVVVSCTLNYGCDNYYKIKFSHQLLNNGEEVTIQKTFEHHVYQESVISLWMGKNNKTKANQLLFRCSAVI